MHAKFTTVATAAAIGFVVSITPSAFGAEAYGRYGVPGGLPYTGGPLPPGFSKQGSPRGPGGNPVPYFNAPGWTQGGKGGWTSGAPGSIKH
jgi:hypothetical protein